MLSHQQFESRSTTLLLLLCLLLLLAACAGVGNTRRHPEERQHPRNYQPEQEVRNG